MEDHNGFDGRRNLCRQEAARRQNRYRQRVLIVLACAYWGLARQGSAQEALEPARAAAHDLRSWRPVGMGGGGAMFTSAISPADPKRILLSCDMSGVYRSADGGKELGDDPLSSIVGLDQSASSLASNRSQRRLRGRWFERAPQKNPGRRKNLDDRRRRTEPGQRDRHRSRRSGADLCRRCQRHLSVCR